MEGVAGQHHAEGLFDEGEAVEPVVPGRGVRVLSLSLPGRVGGVGAAETSTGRSVDPLADGSVGNRP